MSTEQISFWLRSDFFMRLFLVWALAVVIPMGLKIHARRFSVFQGYQKAVSIWPIAGLLLCGSLLLPTGLIAALLTIPMVFLCIFFSWIAFQHLIKHDFKISGRHLSDSFSLAALLVMSLCVLADRIDYQPFGFDPVIIFLTAIHFSFAGFVLPLVAAEVCERQTGIRIATFVPTGIVTGVIGLAIGITSTQLALGWQVELLSAIWLVIFGLFLTAFMIKTIKDAPILAFSGVCLIGGLTLAAFYALRPLYPLAFLDIANMRAIHGILQAIGFSSLALFALQDAKSA